MPRPGSDSLLPSSNSLSGKSPLPLSYQLLGIFCQPETTHILLRGTEDFSPLPYAAYLTHLTLTFLLGKSQLPCWTVSSSRAKTTLHLSEFPMMPATVLVFWTPILPCTSPQPQSILLTPARERFFQSTATMLKTFSMAPHCLAGRANNTYHHSSPILRADRITNQSQTLFLLSPSKEGLK